MLKNKKFVPKNLGQEQERTLNVLLNLFIPPSKDGKIPGAADVGFLAYIQNGNSMPWIIEGLINIIEESHNKYGQSSSSDRHNKQPGSQETARARALVFDIIQQIYCTPLDRACFPAPGRNGSCPRSRSQAA